MRKIERERRRRAKTAAVKTKAKVLLVWASGSAVERARVTHVQDPEVLAEDVIPARLTLDGTTVFLRCDDEGVRWVYGWHGEVPDAFRARVTLTRPAKFGPQFSRSL